jgi:hypothetical protein
VFEHINTTPTDAFTSFSSSLKRCGFAFSRSTPVLRYFASDSQPVS